MGIIRRGYREGVHPPLSATDPPPQTPSVSRGKLKRHLDVMHQGDYTTPWRHSHIFSHDEGHNFHPRFIDKFQGHPSSFELRISR